jgi:hypothetical protein
MGVVPEWMPVRLPPDVYLPVGSKNTVPLKDDVSVVHDMFHHVEADYAVEGMVRKIALLKEPSPRPKSTMSFPIIASMLKLSLN